MTHFSVRLASFLLIFLFSPLPIAQAQTTTVNVGQFIRIIANFTDETQRGPYTYVWNFGDGNIVTGAIDKLGQVPVTYVYNQQGQFTVTFEVTNSIGLSAKGQVVIPVVADIADDPCETNVATVRSQVPWGLWDYPSSWDTGQVPGKDDWVRIENGHFIILPNTNSPISVKGLCIGEHAVLQTAFNTLTTPPSDVTLSAATIRNQGTLQGAYGINGSPLSGTYRHATTGSSLKVYVNRFINDFTGKILGNGRGGDDLPYLYLSNWTPMYARGGDGGSVEIYPVEFVNDGLIQGGDGGTGDTFLDWSHLVDGHAQGGDGGMVRIFATNLSMSTNGPSGQLQGGSGGDADGIARWLRSITVNGRWWSQSGGNWRTVLGGQGGDVSANLGQIAGIVAGDNGDATGHTLTLPTLTIWIDPTTLTVDSSTRLTGADHIILFGGNDWVMDLTQLSAGAITAGKTLTLAVGNGSVIDLRGVRSQVLVASEMVEVFADDIRLDAGLTLADLVDAPDLVRHPSKILYHVELSHPKHVVGEPGETLPIKFIVLNSGPTADTYSFTTTDSAGWRIGPLPANVTVNSLRRTELVFNVTLPTTRGAEDNITITTTSQGDPNRQAIARFRVSVKEQPVIAPRSDQLADFSLVIEDNRIMAEEIQTLANTVEAVLANQLTQQPSLSDDTVNTFLSQLDDAPSKAEMQAFLTTVSPKPSATPAPTLELMTFKDHAISQLVTENLGEMIGRLRSLELASVKDACPTASIAAVESAAAYMNPNGQLVLVTAAAPRQDMAQLIGQLRDKGIQVHIIVTGSCGDWEANQTLYQNLAEQTGGTLNWLPKGITPAAQIENTLATVTEQTLTQVIERMNDHSNTALSTPAGCLLYGVQDEALNDSAFFAIYFGTKTVVLPIGDWCQGCDIEAMDIHPNTDIIYVASGNNTQGHPKGHLYQLDAHTGELVSIGSTGFTEISSLAFDSDGILWAWAKDAGLVQLSIETGQGTLIAASDAKLEDFSFSQDGTQLYGTVDTELWRYDWVTGDVVKQCDNLPQETEAVEVLPDFILPDGFVMLGLHDNEALKLHAFDIKSCTMAASQEVAIPYDDTEGLAMPKAACMP